MQLRAVSRLTQLRSLTLCSDRVGDLSPLSALKHLISFSWHLGFSEYGDTPASPAVDDESNTWAFGSHARLHKLLPGLTCLTRLSLAKSYGLYKRPRSDSLKVRAMSILPLGNNRQQEGVFGGCEAYFRLRRL